MLSKLIQSKYRITSTRTHDFTNMDWEIEDYEVEEENNSFDHAFGTEKRIDVSVGFNTIYLTEKLSFDPDFSETLKSLTAGDTISLDFTTKLKEGYIAVKGTPTVVSVELADNNKSVEIKISKMWVETDWEAANPKDMMDKED